MRRLERCRVQGRSEGVGVGTADGSFKAANEAGAGVTYEGARAAPFGVELLKPGLTDAISCRAWEIVPASTSRDPRLLDGLDRLLVRRAVSRLLV
ncbi:hypothetical protein XI03_20805 [Bradyrhizobium sp. CCBAU 65884]|nr:hypothetical protein [Bradyrhizobium sp. CCBAU 65884]